MYFYFARLAIHPKRTSVNWPFPHPFARFSIIFFVFLECNLTAEVPERIFGISNGTNVNLVPRNVRVVPVRLSVCLSVCPACCLSVFEVCLSVCPSVCSSSWMSAKILFAFDTRFDRKGFGVSYSGDDSSGKTDSPDSVCTFISVNYRIKITRTVEWFYIKLIKYILKKLNCCWKDKLSINKMDSW